MGNKAEKAVMQRFQDTEKPAEDWGGSMSIKSDKHLIKVSVHGGD